MNKVITALLIAVSVFTLNFSYKAAKSLNNQLDEKTVEKATINSQAKTTPKTGKYSLKELSLSNNRQVYIYGPIDETNSPTIAKQLLEFGKTSDPITVIINSPGGSVFDGAEIISALEAAKGPVNTLCVQLCASMAAMIHQYGTHRLMLNRAVLMFHPAAGGLQGTMDQMNSRLTLFKSFVGKMEQNVANRTKTTFDEYKTRATVELWIDAEDSLTQGFADGIVFVRGKDANKLFGDSPAEMKTKKNVPLIIPNDKPVTVPTIPRLDWF